MLLMGCGPMSQLRNVARTAGERETAGGSGEGKEKEEKETAKAPVLGGETAEGYDGFSYLYEQALTAYMEEDTDNGRIKRKEVTIYIPKGKESGVNRELPGTAYADALGVSFQFSLNPYFMDGHKRFPADEKLQAYIDENYPDGKKEEAAAMGYEALEVSEVRQIGTDAASATVKYCLWDDRDEEYSVIYATCYLKELEPDILALLEVEIDSRKVTSRTPELLKELEVFYETDLEWDSGEAQKKLETYLAEKEKEESSGMVEFHFPEGWEIDGSYSEEDMTIYAPGGDCDGAGCGIAVASLDVEEYADELMGWLNDEEYLEMFIREGLGDEAEGLTTRYYGATCIGETTLAEFTYREEGETVDCRLYLGSNGGKVYIIVAIQYQWLEMNTFEVAEELLETGIVTGG